MHSSGSPVHRHHYLTGRWFGRTQLAMRCPKQALRGLLTDTGSLTQKLVALSDGQFRVEVLQQRRARPSRDEARALGMCHRNTALIREVLLYGQDQPWVYARSVLPLASLQGRNRRLAHLGTKPLGAALFADPQLRRRPMQYRYGHIPALPGVPDGPVWGRRSLFILRGKPLLVAEYFLPALPVSH